jgi:hypothetical protein
MTIFVYLLRRSRVQAAFARFSRSLLLVVAALTLSPAIHAQTLEEGALPALTLRLETRIRYVYIDEGDKSRNADVTTARAIVGMDIAITPQLKATLEIIHSDYLPPKRFTDDPAAFTSPYPLLPDPRHTGLNETHLTWTPTPDWTARLGRQRLKIGNERFVSDDNFRNVAQLFDGLLVRGSPFEGAQLSAGQFNRLRTRLGDSEPTQLTLMELAMNPLRDMSVAAYAVRHQPLAQRSDVFRFGVADLSNWVVGAVVDGSYPLGDVRAYYTLEAAQQRSVRDESELSARYLRAGVGAGWKGWIARADHEVKGSILGRYGLQTTLTNQYAFNGNALVFFDTPTTGLRDTWMTLRWEQGPWSMLGEYHWFRSDFGNQRYGREFDANLSYTINPRAYVRAQWARYRPATGGFSTDIDKVWLTVGYEIK